MHPARLAIAVSMLTLAFSSAVFCETQEGYLKYARDYKKLKARVTGRIELPKGYHEGLLIEGDNILIANGDGGKIWAVNRSSGRVVSEIEPIAGFTEALSGKSPGIYFTTDWDEEKLYEAKIENGRMLPLKEMSVSPAHPAGAAWTGEKLYVITWTRGMGTKFDLLELDGDMNLLRKVRIKDIQEPCQMAWDGKDLWITSWFYRLVYRIDINTLKITGRFVSPISKTTGIAWDGQQMWLTGTYADLYRLEIS